MRHRLPAVLLAALTTLLLAVTTAGSPATARPTSESAAQAAPMPTKKKWQADVKTAMTRSLVYLRNRVPDEDVTESKPRCRALFREQGFTLIANIGNNPTDFRAGPDGIDYEKAYRLPNYNGRLS